MKCPACNLPLTKLTVGDIEVDVCKGGCGGIWFDNYELSKFDEPHEHAGESLLDMDLKANRDIDPSQQRYCPKCENTVLHRHFFSVKRKVEVDECPKCGGVWLDEGELKEIRGLYNTEQERKQAAKAYFDEIFGEQLSAMSKQSSEQLAKAKRFANMFKYICPSYYLPGKQDGGAF